MPVTSQPRVASHKRRYGPRRTPGPSALAVGEVAVAYSTSSSLGGAPQTSSVSSYFLSQAAASIDDDGSATQWLRTPSIGFLRRAARVGIAMETYPRTAVTATMEP